MEGSALVPIMPTAQGRSGSDKVDGRSGFCFQIERKLKEKEGVSQ